jgi:hypothetical protein
VPIGSVSIHVRAAVNRAATMTARLEDRPDY